MYVLQSGWKKEYAVRSTFILARLPGTVRHRFSDCALGEKAFLGVTPATTSLTILFASSLLTGQVVSLIRHWASVIPQPQVQVFAFS